MISTTWAVVLREKLVFPLLIVSNSGYRTGQPLRLCTFLHLTHALALQAPQQLCSNPISHRMMVVLFLKY